MIRNKNIIITILMIAVLGIVLFCTSQKIYDLEKRACFETLEEHTEQLSREIGNDYLSDTKYLKYIAGILASYDRLDSREAVQILSSFSGQGMLSRMEILLPGDQLLTSDGRLVSVEGKLSFKEKAAQGQHMSERISDMLAPEQMILCNFVPVKRGTEVIAVLCGICDLDELPKVYSDSAFGENTQLYLVNGTTGNLLMDTWHKDLRHVSDFKKRRTKKGYSMDTMFSDMEKGKSGRVVFFSEKAHTYFYSHYEPVGVANWVVMLSVPEKVVFAKTDQIMKITYFLAIFLMIGITLYFIWLLRELKKEKCAKESQLTRVQYMFDVEKILFDAHMKPGQIEKALERFARALTAERVCLLTIQGHTILQNYFYDRQKGTDAKISPSRRIPEPFSGMFADLAQNKSILLYDMDELGQTYPESQKIVRRVGIRNLMMFPLIDHENGMTGILGACNMEHRWKDTSQMECVSLSFAMAIRNMQVYQGIREMGLMDSLTGLQNRNSYHAAVAEISKNKYQSVGCVYVDANGLHEINNHLGHEAGDQMLCFVARTLEDTFGADNAYRIGGDEFVVLCRNVGEADMQKGIDGISKAMSDHQYASSVGCFWQEQPIEIDTVIKAAEKNMQKAKKQYYQGEGRDRRSREMNVQLEQMITEKQDADVFLSIIAPEFKGVYFVNLSTDTVRHIFIPDYFEAMMKKSGGKFSEAIRLYARELVKPEFSSLFQPVCDYRELESQLYGRDVPGFVYQKKDGSWMKLRIFKFKKYAGQNKETLWVFENTSS
ncbi:sensor domain-containing diguanylate cyclase [Anaerovorax odorimutans]|uniref:Sensor domain-containing diguanylate cyclase n=1 Tax=Anaerovorax odorimutans TaxID=109327 RepID=A0ABT1RQZ2_9FIRM|nr:sensor domain-containing diguanylate cyclase [Anaerovorax odorimutans]MCQ4637620.1 sensor domain-containing diguanylate cyclase [Anaerovorax odorimutans]